MNDGNEVTLFQEFQLARLRYALHQRPIAINRFFCRLNDAAIASLYLSCIDAGVGGEARTLIDSYRRRAASRA